MFETVKQINAGVLDVGYVEAGPSNGQPVILLHGWPYDIHSYVGRRAGARCRGLPRHRPVSPRLRDHALPFERHDPQRPAVGRGGRRHRFDGRARHRVGDRRRLRLGCAHRERRRRALAGPVQGDGLGERLPDRQPGGQQDAVAADGRARVVVPVLFRDRTRPRRVRQVPARIRQAHLAVPHRRSGASTMRRSTAAPPRSTIPTMSTSSWTITAGGSVSRPANRSTTISKRGWPRARSSRCRPSPSKVRPTVRPIPTRVPTPSKFSGKYTHRTITGGVGHNLPQEAPQPFVDAVMEVDRYAS